MGHNFEHGVLAVGQAVYGWVPDWAPSDAASASGRATILDDTKATFAELDDPMAWIAGHRAENSPFWRTVHEVTDALVPDGRHSWYSRVAWANLCPIAPNDRKGNPEGTLREVQTDPAAAYLDVVAAALDPRLVLVLAGPFIWPFVGPLGLGDLTRVAPPLALAGRRRETPWIVGMGLIEAALSAHIALLTSAGRAERNRDETYLERLATYRDLLTVRLAELRAAESARAVVEARYLDGHPALFPDAVTAWDEQLRRTATLANLACRLAELDGVAPAKPPDPEAVSARVTGLVADLVEPAKTTALEKLGEGAEAQDIATGWLRSKLALVGSPVTQPLPSG